jgi:GTP-binding protein
MAGRSNVGKSSLINRLAGKTKLARIGKRPGATTLPNLYRIESGGYFLDFPGYGYMNRSQNTKKTSQDVSTSIIESRSDLGLILLCIDIRRDCLPMDQEAARWFLSRNIPLMMVLTKIDELSKNQRSQQILQWKEWIGSEGENGVLGLYPVSARTGEGIPELAGPLREHLCKTPGTGHPGGLNAEEYRRG